MHKILIWLGYEIPDIKVKKNKGANNFDYFLCMVYAVISLINAAWGINNLSLEMLNKDGKLDISIEALRTLFLMAINGIVLIRMNIKLYIECKKKEDLASEELDVRQRQCATVKIRAIDKRMQFIFYCYVVDVLVLLMNILFIHNGIGNSLAAWIIIPILMTLGNDFVDIAKNKYSAEEKVFYELSTMKGVKIDAD